jgi:transcription initiation factor TFIIB
MRALTSCPKCRLDRAVTDRESGEVVCSLCGMVIEERLEDITEELYTQGLNEGARAPPSIASYGIGLSTIIGDESKDARGQKIQSSVHSAMQRLRTWDYRIQLHDSKERNLKRAFSLLFRLKGKFNLPDAAIESAAHIYRKAVVKRLVSGRSIDAVLVASVFIAARETYSSISLREVSRVSNIRLKTIARIVKVLSSELEISVPVDDPARNVNRVASIIGLSERTRREAADLMSRIKEEEYSAGKNPMCLAATMIYAASCRTGEHTSQKEIAKAAGVTSVTVRARFRDLKSRKLI